MILTLQNTGKMVVLPEGGVARVWEGMTDQGIRVLALLVALGCSGEEPPDVVRVFSEELLELGFTCRPESHLLDGEDEP